MNECLTWAALSDKAAVGDSLSADEQLLLRNHRSQCAVCATEASLWDSLVKVLDEPERLTSRPSAPEPQSARSRLRQFVSRPALVAVIVATSAAAAAAAVTW